MLHPCPRWLECQKVNAAPCRCRGEKVTLADKPHQRHAGLMIDASFRKDGSIEYYVVEGGPGRFYTLDVAREIAEARAKKRATR